MRTSQAATIGVVAVFLLISGCRGGDPQVSPSATSSPSDRVYYTGQTLPAQVDRLSGTPLYSTSTQLSARVKLDGAPFLLIAPQKPSQALLVVETGTTSTELAGRASELADFSGSTETVDAPELIAFVKETFGLELKTDDAGKVVVLKVPRGTARADSGGSAAPSAGTPHPVTATPASSSAAGDPSARVSPEQQSPGDQP